jgi:spore maturation protein A
MLNKIWFWLLLLGIVYGFGKASWRAVHAPPPTAEVAHPGAEIFRDTGAKLTNEALGGAKTAVELCITLIGMMALWLGMLRIARDAGLVDALAKLLRPLLRWLFPDVPDGHPAQGAMLMNIAANVLGLSNAATPFGLKAMRELQTLNPAPDTATNAMATFLTINTAGFTLISFTIIGLRAAAGSESPTAPLAGIVLATTCSTTVGIIVVRLLQRLPRFAPPAPTTPTATTTPSASA